MAKRTRRGPRTSPRPDDPILTLMRPNCSRCGSPVQWLTPQDAATRGIDLTEALTFLGITTQASANVWACTTCDEYGVMTQPQFGTL